MAMKESEGTTPWTDYQAQERLGQCLGSGLHPADTQAVYADHRKITLAIVVSFVPALGEEASPPSCRREGIAEGLYYLGLSFWLSAAPRPS